ncbi:DnaJ-like subfamily C member 2 [Hondaea fermentalgiana]|uniref:DnaJ-like subfamily C member 2 n=1 Tax=Hondaea fermentalgiana TaxID=2315210 RepID=A0A2R5GN46_9STRA|nr:DnaJ-like subfamily C member 2 [Hondaea fermentalgiana]|eukprot:GBG29731.1 DnaJ-like subfamily C member 2 [Hondaea fermentalgiana]
MHEEHCRRVLGGDDGADAAKDQDANGEAENGGPSDADEDAKLRAAWEAKRAARELEASKNDKEDENLYEILGIGHLGFAASAKQIKKAYQKSILIHHPDKLSEEERAKAEAAQLDRSMEEPMFLKVQRAWDILSNPAKKRGYDSNFAFDDRIPSASLQFEEDEDFFEAYGPVFERNARFSNKKPVPMLGDMSTNITKVQQFYRFWTHFSSWREFSKFDEFKDGDLESAGSRYERRWMQRQNDIIRGKKKKEEIQRVRDLVERAMAVDPRLLRAKEDERQEKERKRKERIMERVAAAKAAKEAEETERKRREEEERKAKEEADKARQEKQTTKKAFKKQIRILRKCCDKAAEMLDISADELSDISHEITHLSEWFSQSSDVADCVLAFRGDLPPTDDWFDPPGKEAAQAGVDAIRRLHASAAEEKEAQEADDEEERARRLEEDQRAREAQKKEAEADPWTPDELSGLAKAIRKYPPGSRNRWVMISNYMNTLPGHTVERSPDDCLKQSKAADADLIGRKQLGTAESAFSQYRNKLASKTAGADVDADAADAGASTPAAEAPNGAADAQDEDVWTPEQQSALEAALKEFPASMDKNERWKSIAKAVPGKKKKDCVARFKELRAKVLEKRGTK